MMNQLNLFSNAGVRALVAGALLLALTAIACGGAAPAAQAEPITVEVTRVVEQPGPEVTREVQVEVTRIVEHPGAEVTREVPVEVTRVVREFAPNDDPGELIIYSGRSESLVDPIIQQFKGATGIDVRVKYAGTAALAATLLEEGANSPADVFYAQDPGGLAAVSEMMTELPTDIIEMTPEWARSAEGHWVGVTGRARVVVYGTDQLSEDDLPNDLWGFTEPEWKGRVGWAPTNGSFQAMVTALRRGWGEERAEEWLRAMIANDVKIYPKNTPQVAAAAAGEIDVGLVNHYYLYRFIAEEGEDFAARNAHLRGAGPGSIVLVSGAGILETADNPENAEAFIRFLLSSVGQQYFAGQTFEYPMVEGVRPSVLLTPLAEIEQPEITLADLSDLAGTQALLQKTGALP
ncbi:MAG: iron ABC transporter substrate-binding protein [Chloroflexota bacterium]|nr:iron ABC transporter substrate-binding protein [Chloroflexota bacterium]MDE2683938.1 iron ABC transporter substrate-binding protein [Chloroflexota bacterium]